MARFAAVLLARWGPRLALLGALGGCVEPYAPDVVAAPASYLVVDGFINGNGVTRIQLSRTASLATTGAPAVERGAKLFILDDAGGRYALAERASGTYVSDSLLLSPARQYQLFLTRAAGAVAYASDLVPLKITPPIDQLGWALGREQVQLTVSTHDPRQQSHYYRWGFVETWEFNSAFESSVEYNAAQQMIVPRTTPIYTCWQTARSSAIQQGSSAQLGQDVLTDFPLLAVPARAERLKVRYSVLVNQYAETAAEFAYYELLRKNTEAVGTVNDPLPTQLTGNVHRVDNAAEPVLGYVGAHTVQQKRLFINRADLNLPKDWAFDTPYNNCVLREGLEASLFMSPGNVPISYDVGTSFIGSTRECVDCRLRGSNVKPSFW